MRRILFVLVLVARLGSAAGYHEFEGLSEYYNIRNLRALAAFLPEEPVIVEAGAYEGRDTLKLAQKLPAARIYAFEPLLTAFPKLVEAIQSYPKVLAFNVALDQTSGMKPFYICYGTDRKSPVFEFHSSLLRPLIDWLQGPVTSVPTVSLFDFCNEQKLERLDMLWLSAEGNEKQILEGAQHFLDQVSVIFVRSKLVLVREGMTLFVDLKKYLEEKGFLLVSHFYYKNIHGDALFIRKEKFEAKRV